MRSISIFRAGPHYPALDAAGLARTVSAYDPAKHEAPLVIGHPADDHPAYGWVQSLAFSEGLLQATTRQVDQALRDQVDAGRYRKISAGFYHPESAGNPVPGTFYLRHVGFLGAQPPAVKGLPAVQFADSENDYVTIEFSESDPWAWRILGQLFRGLREQLIASTDLETADRVLPDYEIETLTQQAERMTRDSQPVAVFSEPATEEPPMTLPSSPTPEERDAALTQRETQLSAREQAMERQASEQARQETVAFCEKLVTEGRLLPRDREAMAELFGGLSGEATVTFAEGDSLVAKPGVAAAFLRQFLTRLPVQVDFSERAPAGAPAPAPVPGMALPAGHEVDAGQAGLHQRALQFAEQHNVVYDEAVTRVAALEV